MGVDYRDQYKPEHLEAFFPNEIFKMCIVVLCTLAILMFLVVLPILISNLGITGVFHEEQPANPSVTPPHIRPEWYFLAVYQYLKLMPQEIFGIDGKALGIFTQGIGMLTILLLPFWFPLRTARIVVRDWRRGILTYACMLGLFVAAALSLGFWQFHLESKWKDLLHPMFTWPVLAVVTYILVGRIAQKTGFADIFRWLNLFNAALLLIAFQYLVFIVVLGQGLAMKFSPSAAYLGCAVPMLVAIGIIVRFTVLRVKGRDETLRRKIFMAFITEGILLFAGLTLWGMWPAGGIYTTEHGWHHEAKGLLFFVLIMLAALIVLYALLVAERKIINRTLSPEERDKIE